MQTRINATDTAKCTEWPGKITLTEEPVSYLNILPSLVTSVSIVPSYWLIGSEAD